MLILFDQSTPLPLRRYLRGHNVRSASQQGWDRLENGSLLAAAEAAGFDLFVTADKNIQYQQNLSARKISIIVLGVQHWPTLAPHAQQIIAAVERATVGSYEEVALVR